MSLQNAPVLELSTDLGESGVESSVERCDIDSLADKDLELRTPKKFYGPDAENSDEDKLLA
ncbi:hypothetical protein N7505_001421 [Penicillium chrysogenum]|uniref:Uncharacterized protein n=1 Tax=Penicillium chrysogenum TaxID=5076 RepID=A0ABQ8WZA9_PENCH|nr:hypothetical protein N7505_001421 [Penicillium chrysogenum]